MVQLPTEVDRAWNHKISINTCRYCEKNVSYLKLTDEHFKSILITLLLLIFLLVNIIINC